jgi:DNA-directed RNA polymerase subunit RPC12/RpoP
MIRFKCIYCGEQMEAPATLTVGKMECPQCHHAVAVRKPENPHPPDNPAPKNNHSVEDDDILLDGPPVLIKTHQNEKPPAPRPASPSDLPPPTLDQLPKIHFRCSCGQALKASMEHAGKRITCPHCTQKRTIPDKSKY